MAVRRRIQSRFHVFRFFPRLDVLESRTLLSGTPGWFDSPWRSFDTGYFPGKAFGPSSIAVGDLDGDGDSDAVISNSLFSAAGLSVLRNNGDGTLSPPQIISLPFNYSVGEVALADMDIDGDLDAVVTIPGPDGLKNEIALFRNVGNGMLARRGPRFPAGPGPIGLTIGDFTGDGFPDVVTANYGYVAGNNATISLIPHNGVSGPGASFLAPVSFNVGMHPQAVASADLNADGHLDIAVARSHITGTQFGYLSILFGIGTGGFSVPVDYEMAPAANYFSPSVALADMDNDGDFDLLGGGMGSAGSLDNGLITIRRNAGNGTFGPAEKYIFGNYEAAPQALGTADLNGDGFLDVLAATDGGRATDGLNILRSNGAGGFFNPVRYEAGQQTFDVAAVDVDGDGDLDPLTVANSSAALTVHYNPGTGVFPVLPRYGVGNLTEGQDFADIDLDGDLDVVTNDDQARILKNNGAGVFAPAQTFVPPKNMADLRLRDLNGDGFVDILMGPDAEFPAYHFVTALNHGNGTFAPGTIWNVNSCGQGTIDAFDFDNDGDRDVVLTEEQGCAGGSPPRIFVYRNNGAASFTLATVLFPPGFARNVAGADLNHDGNLDIVTSLGTGVGVYLGNGDLTFQAPLVSSAANYKFTLVDLNRDGDLDIGMIIPQGSFGTVPIGAALGNGDGTFGPPQLYNGSSVLESAYLISHDIDAADVNLDGFPDLLITNNASNDLSLFVGKGDGTLHPQQRYGAGYSAWLTAFADFTGDGTPDAATVISLPPSGLPNAIVLVPGQVGRGYPDSARSNHTNRIVRAAAASLAMAPSFGTPTATERTDIHRFETADDMARNLSGEFE